MIDKLCPLLKEPCIEHKCKFYIHLLGNDPQVSNKTIDSWDCAIAWMPILLIENAAQGRQAGAAIESFRNVLSNKADALLALASAKRLGNGEER